MPKISTGYAVHHAPLHHATEWKSGAERAILLAAAVAGSQRLDDRKIIGETRF